MSFEKEYDTEYLTKIIEYNHNRHISFLNNLPFEYNLEYEKVLNARYCKVGRIKKRLVYLLTRCEYVWFCTFTFDDRRIKFSTKRKRELIREVLNTHDFIYILNVDYGKTTEREHYHCILGTNINFNVNQYIQDYYPCFSLSIQCKKGIGDYQRLSKYINKLTNHCIKATTKRQRIVYNFKGYDTFCPTSKDKSYAFHKDLELLINDTLLDKGVISAENF